MHAERTRQLARAGRGSVVEQFRRRHNWRRTLREEQAFMPCWVASFVIHLVLLIVLATLILPETDDPFLRPLLLSLSTEMAPTRPISTPPTLITRQENIAQGNQGSEEMADRDVASEQAATLAEAGEPAAEQPAVPTSQPQPQPPAAAPQSFAESLVNPFAEPAGRREAPARLLNVTASRAAAMTAPLSTLDTGPRQAYHDQIVDRFIEYDIGRLRGAEGSAALRDFELLGPEAIPALVRGLNRSASIHASCPVCVITSKLNSTLSQSKDRSMFAYAVANIGRDVPETAPHYSRLVNLLDQLTDSPDGLIAALEDPDSKVRQHAMEQLLNRQAMLRFSQKVSLAQALTKMVENDRQLGLAAHRLLVLLSVNQPGAPDENQLEQSPDLAAAHWRALWTRMEQSEALKSAAPYELHKALQSPDPAIRQAAAQATAVRRGKMTDGQKLLLARKFIDMLSSDEPLSHELAQQALIVMAQQTRPRSLSPGQWTSFWDNVEREKLIGPRAQAYLGMARSLEGRGDVKEALSRYNRILMEFPDTPAAEHAAQRLAELRKSQ